MIGQNFISRIPSEHKPFIYKAATATALAAGSLCTPWESVRIIGSTILTGVSYGIVNEKISSWGCSQHFFENHISDRSNLRNRPIQGLNSNLNAIVSGMLNYWSIASIFGMVLAAVARAPLRIDLKIKATQITPYLVIGATLVTLVIQVATRIIQTHCNTKKQTKQFICSTQHGLSYGFFVTGHILLAVAVLVARIGRFRF
ncbi:MAG: hypothetical protein ACRDAI_02350 [Candidatus Rhabdochlamydia sp.]